MNFKRSFGVLAAACTMLAGCAVTTVDVDVYKGPLADHEDVQLEQLAAMVVGTLNMLTVSWAIDERFPVFAKLEEARLMFERLICKDNP